MTYSRLRHGPGAWRTDSVVDDLYRWASMTRDETAIIAGHGEHTTRITYGEYADHVDRYAAALRELGVGSSESFPCGCPTAGRCPP